MVNPKDAARKLLEPISEFSKDAGYKINIQKSVAFLYNNNKWSERNWVNNPIYHHIEKTKTLRKNGTKEEKGLYMENYRHRWQKVKMTQIETYSWTIGILLICPYCSKQSADLMQFLSK